MVSNCFIPKFRQFVLNLSRFVPKPQIDSYQSQHAFIQNTSHTSMWADVDCVRQFSRVKGVRDRQNSVVYFWPSKQKQLNCVFVFLPLEVTFKNGCHIKKLIYANWPYFKYTLGTKQLNLLGTNQPSWVWNKSVWDEHTLGMKGLVTISMTCITMIFTFT